VSAFEVYCHTVTYEQIIGIEYFVLGSEVDVQKRYLMSTAVDYMRRTFRRLRTVHLEAVPRPSLPTQPVQSVIILRRRLMVRQLVAKSSNHQHGPRKLFKCCCESLLRIFSSANIRTVLETLRF